MSNFIFHDISYAQGQYDMDADPNPAIEMKMTGFYYGSKTPYTDVQGARNYQNAVRTNKVPILYHFAGGADPVAEADYFVNEGAMPFADGDIYMLDYELNASMNPPADPDSWCRAFADRVKERTGVYPLFYTYTSLLNQHGNFPKTLEVCGLIQANYGVSPDATIPGPAYIIQQYTDAPFDTNASFIDLETLRKYAYHAPAVIPQPEAAPAPSAAPEPAPQPEPVPGAEPASPAPAPAATPEPSVTGTVESPVIIVTPPAVKSVVVTTPRKSFLERLLALLKLIFIGKE